MFGEITNGKELGGWTLINQSAGRLPQPLASAFVALFTDREGAKYSPVWYVGTQPVNGVNHKLIVERKRLNDSGKTVKEYVVVVINIPAGSADGKGATIVSEEDTTDFILRDGIEKGFKKAMAGLTDTSHAPLVELGTQTVKGVNFHFICQSKALYSGAEPYLTHVVINNFQENWAAVEINRIA